MGGQYSLTPNQLQTLTAIIANGGVVNGDRGQPGIATQSIANLLGRGLLESVPPCATCSRDALQPGQAGAPLKRELSACTLPQLATPGCFNRVQITPVGRLVVDLETNHRVDGLPDTAVDTLVRQAARFTNTDGTYSTALPGPPALKTVRAGFTKRWEALTPAQRNALLYRTNLLRSHMHHV